MSYLYIYVNTLEMAYRRSSNSRSLGDDSQRWENNTFVKWFAGVGSGIVDGRRATVIFQSPSSPGSRSKEYDNSEQRSGDLGEFFCFHALLSTLWTTKSLPNLTL